MADSDSEASKESNITEAELQKEIVKILENADLQTTSTNKVIQKLEKKFGVSLTEKKKMIDRLVLDYVNSLDSSDSEEEEEKESEKEEEEEEEEEEKKPRIKKEKVEDTGTTTRRGRRSDDKKKKTPAKGKKGGVKKGGGKGSGYTRPIKLSQALSELVGATELPRHEVVKRVWAIIKERQLTDPNNRQFAICDKPLYKVIGTQRFYTFGMMKYLKNHFIDD
ncbi:unnamed protein product [Arctia plantaginis]|uniref:Upstream activation factor subunit spp27 n=1 Tax=Arctia plantaginis TaxID=874455 RepID=A0A8S0ZGK9_ARCPL|nr:unnamed protein product [Arctia plantaginis]